MTVFASATFTGTQFAELASQDANWTKVTGFTQDLILGTGGTYVICNSAGSSGCYRHTTTPPSADYEVSVDIAKLSGARSPQMGPIARASSSAETFYFLLYIHGTGLGLYKRVSGVTTKLGSTFSLSLTSTPVTITLRCEGSSISGKVSGVTQIGPVTDTAITAAGFAGVRGFDMRETGVADAGSLDNFSADSIEAGTASRLPPRSLGARIAPYLHF